MLINLNITLKFIIVTAFQVVLVESICAVIYNWDTIDIIVGSVLSTIILMKILFVFEEINNNVHKTILLLFIALMFFIDLTCVKTIKESYNLVFLLHIFVYPAIYYFFISLRKDKKSDSKGLYY